MSAASRRLKRDFAKMSAEDFRCPTFGQLEIGDRFIALPLPGDNVGHGGFMQTHRQFIKIAKIHGPNRTGDNAICLKSGHLSGCPDDMFVIVIE